MAGMKIVSVLSKRLIVGSWFLCRSQRRRLFWVILFCLQFGALFEMFLWVTQIYVKVSIVMTIECLLLWLDLI